MSCGNLCPCQFNWPLDTHGFKKDTISSEKAWLDFAVRYLSREAAGKGNGQETVWSEACKPSWWDSTVNLPWKNPTTNPKDNKDILLKKYEALEGHLRKESRFPSDLEEEAKLWADGKHKELFLLCHLTCLLRKVSGVHLAIEEACSKADKMKAQINQGVLQNIRNCLSSALKATEKFKQSESPKQLKRSHNDRNDFVQAVPSKRLKRVHENVTPLVPILPKPEQIAVSPTSVSNIASINSIKLSATNSEIILNYANKILEKRKSKAYQGKFDATEIITKTCSNQNSCTDVNSFVFPETCSPSVPASSLPLDLPNVDFLLSPLPNEVAPNNCFSDIDNTNVLTAFPFETFPPKNHETENVLQLVSSEPSISPSLDVSGNIVNRFNTGSPSDAHALVIESNNSSPHSIVSETHSCPVTNSDGGYISAEDLNFDLEELMTDDIDQWSEKDSYGLERFLFDNFDQNPSSNPDVSLLDQWDISNDMAGS